MGCDIHVHVEIKVKDKWEHYNIPQVRRYYKLFGLLAGVRDPEQVPIVQPRGVPNDISLVTKLCLENRDGDYHTASWLTCEEIEKVQQTVESWTPTGAAEEVFGYIFGNTLYSHLEYESSKASLDEAGISDVRVVFWFDC